MSVENPVDRDPEIPNLGKLILEKTVANWKRYPSYANRASSVGHECERFLVYQRVAWEQRERPSDTLLSIFEEGDLHENATKRELDEIGFPLIEQQGAIQYKEHEISGRIDGALVLEKAGGHPTLSYPVDIKSCSGFVFDKLFKSKDNAERELAIRTHDSPYIRGYYAQMQIYCLLKNQEKGILVFKNKQTGLVDQINVHLDLAFCEELVQKADRVNAHVKAGTLPDRIPFKQDVCGRCDFFLTCLPDEAARAGTALLDNPEMVEKIRRMLELEKAHKEYEKLAKQVKDEAKQAFVDLDITDGDFMVNAEFIVRQKSIQKGTYTVKAQTQRNITIEQVRKGGEA